ncbi:hypothetical protein CYY_000665 [Polysphondylium violaceum]|uniref:Ubiquitin-like domain-containing protein n=1 Tax=Polysphondylium violaceum TaxID=133409 RepID=A0A8J4Q4B8_9MYCE|nr:hypothetical protein CYY_000665 [Polysphondylium violaceum]
MLILIKTPTITFSLDVSLDDSLEVLYTKVSERTSHPRFQFNLMFAGDVLSKGTVGACGIKKESTIHMMLIKEIKVLLQYKGKEYMVELPNNKGLKMYHLIKQIKTNLEDQIEELKKYNVTVQLKKENSDSFFSPNDDVQEKISTFDRVDLVISGGSSLPPVPPPIPAYKSKSTTTTSTKGTYTKGKSSFSSTPGKSAYDSSSESDSSDDEYTTPGGPSRYHHKPSSTPVPPPPPPVEEYFDKDALLSSFVESSISSDVEIVFCFDTTGSMASIIQSVRTQVVETVSRLMKDIPNIKIGIMGMGDYCDGVNVLKVLDLSQDIARIVSFINGVPNTSGGDAPEAYEFALRKAKELSWSQHTSKAFVMIGDSNPHQPTFTDLNINWFQECDDLYDKGIKIYGVRALGNSIFYDDIAERSGGICINFKKFNLITEMFLAICYREASKEKFEEYQKEINQGEVCEEMNQIFDDLNQENFTVVKKEEMTKDEATKSSLEQEKDDDIFVGEEKKTTTTTTTTAAKKNVVVKEYGVPSMIKVREAWYDFSLNKSTSPSYFYNPNLGYFEPNTGGRKAKSTKPTSPLSSLPSSAAESTLTASSSSISLGSSVESSISSIFNFASVVDASSGNNAKVKELKACCIGDAQVGKTTLVNGLNHTGRATKSIIKFYEPLENKISMEEFNKISFFVVCFSHSVKHSFDNVNNYLVEIRKRDATKPIIVVACKTDVTSTTPHPIADYEKFRQIYSLLGAYAYNQHLPTEQIKKIEKDINVKYNQMFKSSNSSSCSIM